MKYKVGDEVRVISDNNYGFKQGYIGRVTLVDTSYGSTSYLVDEDYWYGEEELVSYSEYTDNTTQRIRGFEVVTGYEDITLPTRKTRFSAGYDIEVAEDVYLAPGESKVFPTGIKAYMQYDEVLEIYIRSSIGIKHGVKLSNSTGIIDADYYDNPRTQGHIMMALKNCGTDVFSVPKGTRVAQGIFQKYLVCDGDDVTTERNGGIGSTN